MKKQLKVKIDETFQSRKMFGGACGGGGGNGDSYSGFAGGPVGPSDTGSYGSPSSVDARAQTIQNAVRFYTQDMARLTPVTQGYTAIAEVFCAPCHAGFKTIEH
ncbi:MAG: hypothetical protein A2283_07885 [Lentisphaerae bacterium RIFOXYA12_FULL_48_11]|nr:MAG: hypothetical protein A2283_07885 [Lentisphaerae bacterium RIFOXYA12_FULL_48_11]